jgi:hypothetical protein
MVRKVYIVQFTHPGGEHTLNRQEKKGHIKEWNYGGHKRKFLKAVGQCVQEDGSLTSKKELLFWGEWEPTSMVNSLNCPEETAVMPNFVHEPFLTRNEHGLVLPPWKNGKFITRNGKKEPCKRQNTDPFVFGDYFLYSCCKQRKKIKNSAQTTFTKLGELEKGSIILFGSTISKKQGGPYFVLDTVFVVGDYKNYNSKNSPIDLKDFVPSDYFDIMGFTNWDPVNDFVCYKGATVSNPFDGMFSFVPCKPFDSTGIGFPRVKLTSTDLDIISDNLNAAPKFRDDLPIKDLWNKICDIVRKQGFELGVNFEYQYENTI